MFCLHIHAGLCSESSCASFCLCQSMRHTSSRMPIRHFKSTLKSPFPRTFRSLQLLLTSGVVISSANHLSERIKFTMSASKGDDILLLFFSHENDLIRGAKKAYWVWIPYELRGRQFFKQCIVSVIVTITFSTFLLRLEYIGLGIIGRGAFVRTC